MGREGSDTMYMYKIVNEQNLLIKKQMDTILVQKEN